MAQPTDPLIIWAEDNVNLPVTGQPNKSVPQESLRKTGWDRGQKPSCEELNYILNNLAQYIKYYGTEQIPNILQQVYARKINTGAGLTGGGDLSADRTLALATPSTVGLGSTNIATNSNNPSHTHALNITGNISILTGTVSDQGTIPLPEGYLESQCAWTVSPSNVYMTEITAPFSYRTTCFTTGRLVRVYGSLDDGGGVNPGVANYIIIGVK